MALENQIVVDIEPHHQWIEKYASPDLVTPTLALVRPPITALLEI
jgi:hypothetical protein